MNADTRICVSIAARPGTFGVRFHNSGYRLFDLNFAYVPLCVRAGDTEHALRLVRDNFHGCSVSMPHKLRAMELADELHETASRTGAANTLLRAVDGTLTAFNTDLMGVLAVAASRRLSIAGAPVLMLGAGGVARAIAVALTDAGARLVISSRTAARAEVLARQVNASVLSWHERNDASGYLLVNATPIGMDGSEIPLAPERVASFDVVMDVVIHPESALISAARKAGKTLIPGMALAAYQAAEQFRIYTGQVLPDAFVQQAAEGSLP